MSTEQEIINNAKKQYILANAAGRKILESIFDKSVFAPKIQDQVKGLKDACVVLNRPYEQYFSKSATKNMFPHEVAYRKITFFIEAINFLNNNWKADFKNPNQEKHSPYFINDPKDKAGFGLSLYDTVCTRTSTYLGSRLVVGNKELALYVGTTMLKEYNEMFL